MKKPLRLLTLAALVLSMSSCGLPAALARSAGRVVQGVGDVANQAMTTGL